MMMLRTLCTILLFAIGSKLSAQSGSFSPVPATFIAEFEAFIAKANDKNLTRNFAVFKENWELGKFSPSQQKFIIDISNQMLAEKMALQPHFQLFMTTVAAFLENQLPDKVLVQWQNITKSLLGNSNKEYLDFLQTTANLFANKSIYQSGTTVWKVDTLDFDMFYKGEIEIHFGEVDLTCQGFMDKMVVKGTKGIYKPAKNIWIGEYGSADFQRCLPDESAYVRFNQYRLNLDVNTYSVDSAALTYNRYFKTAVYGKFTDKLSTATDSLKVKKSGFPQFNSYDNELLVRGIVGDESFFRGGFTMQGHSITTATANGKPSVIDVFYKGKKKVTLKSKSFKITDGIAGTLQAEYTLYLDSVTTIYHPFVKVNFIFKDNKLIVERGEEGLMRVPFSDNYHNVSLDVQQVRWVITEPFVDFDNVNNDLEARISSDDFFRDILYNRLQGPLRSHPLEGLVAYYNRQPEDPLSNQLQKDIKNLMLSGKPEDKAKAEAKMKQLQARKAELREYYKADQRVKFSLDDYAFFQKTQKEYLVAPFLELHDQGYINYLQDLDSAILLPKAFRYVQAHQKMRDYDVIRISSIIGARPNFTLNLLSNEMNLEGVSKFFFSDSQNVIVAPYNQQVTLTKNRGLRFGGQLRAGRFDFYGKKYVFNYGQFNIAMSAVDSLQMYFPDSSGRRLVPIKSVLRNVSGTLYIDKPNNKSGNKDYPEYPIFVSDKGSEVLYDKPHIHGGAYEGDKFKFVVDPFTIDSLDNFTIAGLRFDGNFISDGIFPEFRHYVTIQKDYSLGFIKHTPPGGYSMYRGKGLGDMTMNLSEEGFYGTDGTIQYQGSKSEFSKILLLPKKAVGVLNRYDLTENTKYPEVHAVMANMEWNPYQDEYNVTNGTTPIKMFKVGHDFTGTITQSPSVIKGNGTLAWDQAKFYSQEQVFGPQKSTAKKANLQIYAADSSRMAFETSDINGTMDFSKRIGTFTKNEPGSMTKFDYNMYQTNLTDYRWDMDKKIITAKVGPSLAGQTPIFASTNPTQGGLSFEAKRADYSLVDYTLKISEIPYIDIADSRLFLKDGKATVRANADMDQLDSTKLIAGRDNKFHEIYKLKVKVYGKNKIRGNGFYQYVNSRGGRQEFFLDSVIVNDNQRIEGVGKIAEEQNFTLETKIGYKGFAQIESTEKLIRFTGYVKPLHTFKNIYPSAWIRFDNRVDPKDVVLDMTDPRDKDNKKQYVGLFVANDSSFVYPLMYSWKRRYSDDDVTNDTGIFYYDNKTESFYAGSKSRLRDGGLKGSWIRFNERDHSIHAEGPLDFGLETPNVKFKNAGTADLYPGDSSFVFNLAMMLDFPMHPDYVERLVALINENGGAAATVNTDFFKQCLGEMMENEKSYRQVVENLMKNGELKGKDEAEYKLVLSDATFRWDSKLRGMYCNDIVSVASIAGKPINKNMHAVMLLEHKRSGQNMYVYLDLGANDYIYINLTKTGAIVYSTDQNLQQILTNTADKVKAENYFIRPATERQVEKFLRRFE